MRELELPTVQSHWLFRWPMLELELPTVQPHWLFNWPMRELELPAAQSHWLFRWPMRELEIPAAQSHWLFRWPMRELELPAAQSHWLFRCPMGERELPAAQSHWLFHWATERWRAVCWRGNRKQILSHCQWTPETLPPIKVVFQNIRHYKYMHTNKTVILSNVWLHDYERQNVCIFIGYIICHCAISNIAQFIKPYRDPVHL